MNHAFNTLVPVFLIIGLGAALRHRGFFDERFIDGLNNLCYWIGLPCLILVGTIRAGAAGVGVGNLLIIQIGACAGIIAASYLAAWWFKYPGPTAASFIQASFRGNMAYIGLQIIFFAYAGADAETAERASSMAALSLGPMVFVFNIAAVMVMLGGQRHPDGFGISRIIRNFMINPLILAAVLGLAWLLAAEAAGVKPMPQFLDRAFSTVGQMALPLSLLCVGGAVAATPIAGRLPPSLLAAVLKLVAAPALGLAIAHWLGASRDETFVALVLLGCPTAVSSYVLADRLGADAPLAAAAIVVSTIASAASLGLILALW